MILKGRVDRAFKRLGLDRCPCEAEQRRFTVIMPDEQAPSLVDACARCGRALADVIQVIYQEPEPPGWFLAERPRTDAETVRRLWAEFLSNWTPGDYASAPSERPMPVVPPVALVDEVAALGSPDTYDF